MRHFLLIKDFVLEHKWRYVTGILWLLMVDLVQMVTPRILGTITDGLRYHTLDAHSLEIYGLLICGVAVFTGLARFMWRIYVMGTSRKLEFVLRNRLYTHLQTLSAQYFNHHKTGDLMAHATNDISAVRMAMGPGIVMLFDPLFMICLTVIMMISTVGWSLTFWALIPLPIMAVVTRMFGKMIHKRFSQVQEAFSGLTDRVQENMSGMRVVQSYVQENAEIEVFTKSNRNNFEKNMNLARIQSVFNPLVQFISTLSFLIALSYGGYLVIQGTISLGEFVAFDVYLALLTWPIMAIGWVINNLQRGAASLERLGVILYTQPDIVESTAPANVPEIEGMISIRDLTFVYPGSKQPALQNINLEIPVGSSVGIIGRTGSGKTTLVNLLLRMYDVSTGTIRIDGHDIRELLLSDLRKEIGYVPQDNFLFSKTIRENIAFADDQLSMDSIVEAAKIAQVHENIIDFPTQYETMLGERGVTLSGGQKQRISIARAIIKNPRILILDDSLSAVDTRTEEAILNGLYDMMRERTTLLIAHRISTIKWCEQILVLDEGKIVQRGTHSQLLEETGLYAELYQKQLLEERIASGE